MKKTFTPILLLCFALSSTVLGKLNACSCGEFPTFCENAVSYNLFMGRVLSHQESPLDEFNIAYFTNLEVIDFMNTAGLPDTVSMINQDGVNCNGSIFGMNIGDSVIISIEDLAFEVIYNPEEYENLPPHTKYDLFGCGTYFLRVQDAKVGGVIETQEIVELDDFLANPSANCPRITRTENPLAGQLAVYPNPVKEQLTINNQAEEKVNCTLFDINGVTVSQFKIWPGQQEQLPMNDLPAGSYILKVTDGINEHSQVVIRQ